jgi:tetratricopeptide (TPR) repeat protein
MSMNIQKPWKRSDPLVIVQQAAEGPSSSPRNARLAALSEFLSLIWSISLKVLVPIGLIAFVLYFFHLAYTRTYRLAPFRGSTELEGAGYTGDVLRDAFAFRVSEIESRANNAAATVTQATTAVRRIQSIQTTESKLDFQIPRTSFSFQGLVQYVRDAIGPGDIVVSADIVKVGSKFQMFALISDPKPSRPDLNLSSVADTVDDVIRDNALKVVSQLDPVVSGYYKMSLAETKCPGCDIDDFRDAISDLRSATSDANVAIHYRALIGLSRLFAKSGNHLLAAFYAEAATKVDDSKPDAFEMLGIEYVAMSRYKEADEIFERISQQYPDSAFPFSDWGDSLVAQGRFEEALAKYQQSFKAWDANPEAKARYAYTLYRAGRYGESIDAFYAALALDPTNAAHQNDFANALRERVKQLNSGKFSGAKCDAGGPYPQYRDAIATHRAAAKLATNDAAMESRIELDLGKTYKACGDPDSALRHFSEAARLDTSNAYAHDEARDLLLERKRVAEAVQEGISAILVGDYNKTRCDILLKANAEFVAATALTMMNGASATRVMTQCEKAFSPHPTGR